MFDSILDVAPEYFDKAIHSPNNETFLLIVGFWVFMFIIAFVETSTKNRRGK